MIRDRNNVSYRIYVFNFYCRNLKTDIKSDLHNMYYIPTVPITVKM